MATTMMILRSAFFGLSCILFVPACDAPGSQKEESKEELEATAPADTQVATAKKAESGGVANPKAKAKKVFAQRCVTCHGDDGAGDGPGSAALDPKPRAFADAEWQESVTDEHIAKVIVSGGAAVGKSPVMPGTPDLKKTPEVVDELVEIIRGFEK